MLKVLLFCFFAFVDWIAMSMKTLLLFLLKYDLIFKKSFKNNIIQNYELKIKALQKHSPLTPHLHLKPHDLNLGDRDYSIPSFSIQILCFYFFPVKSRR